MTVLKLVQKTEQNGEQNANEALEILLYLITILTF